MTNPGAPRLVIERVMPERMAAEPAATAKALSGLRMLVRTGERERKVTEFAALFGTAGLRLLSILPNATPFRILACAAA